MALSKLAVKRLSKLADYMHNLPRSAEKHFKMHSYASHEGEHEHKFPHVISRRELNFCGTSACVLGWAATIPNFKRAGLALIYSYDDFILQLNGEQVGFGWRDDDNISQLFPGLKCGHAEYLFGGRARVRTPKQWAARCRKFIEKNRA